MVFDGGKMVRDYIKHFIYTLIITFVSTFAFATPSALNISDILQIDESDIFFGTENFKISTQDTNWSMRKIDKSNSSAQAQFLSPNAESQAKLTVRYEKLKNDLTLKAYVKNSMRDYGRYGFEILTKRPLKISDQYAYLIDFKQNKSAVQIRQVLFKNKNVVVILTCSALQENFKQELKSCNQIYRNFRWL